MVRLDDYQLRIRTHPAQDFLGHVADPRAVLDDHAGTRPVDMLQQLADEKAGTGNDRTQHARVAKESPDKQEIHTRFREHAAFLNWASMRTAVPPEAWSIRAGND